MSQRLIHEGEWGGVIKNSFENINEIEHLAKDNDESEFQSSFNSEESTKKNHNKHNLVIISSALNKKKKQKLNSDQWLETGVLIPEKIYVPTNIIRKMI